MKMKDGSLFSGHEDLHSSMNSMASHGFRM